MHRPAPAAAPQPRKANHAERDQSPTASRPDAQHMGEPQPGSELHRVTPTPRRMAPMLHPRPLEGAAGGIAQHTCTERKHRCPEVIRGTQAPSCQPTPITSRTASHPCLLDREQATPPAARSDGSSRSTASSHLHLRCSAGVPNPAGAETRTSLWSGQMLASSCSISRGRGTRSGRTGGTWSLVFKRGVSTSPSLAASGSPATRVKRYAWQRNAPY